MRQQAGVGAGARRQVVIEVRPARARQAVRIGHAMWQLAACEVTGIVVIPGRGLTGGEQAWRMRL